MAERPRRKRYGPAAETGIDLSHEKTDNKTHTEAKILTKPPKLPDLATGDPLAASRMTKRAYQNVFERLGGEDRLLEEAKKDPKWFYEKIHAKIVQPEKIEIAHERTLAERLAELDAYIINVTPEPVGKAAIEVDFEEKK